VAGQAVLQSKWSGLSPALFASLQPVDFNGAVTGGVIVRAPYTEGQIESSANWSSPHENAGVDSARPALAAGAQSGSLLDLAKAMKGKTEGFQAVNGVFASAITGLESAQGRTGMTKINSRQIYTGSAPVKIPLTLKFRAFSDAASEVERPIEQLFEWHLAQKIAGGTALSALLSDNANKGLIENLLPSIIPQILRLELGASNGSRSFSPVVIESISHPLKVPRSKDGEMLNVEVQINVATLVAMDKTDWLNTRKNMPIQVRAITVG
jgi:hypothetical protein